MLKHISIGLLFLATAFSASVPCTQYQSSTFGNATDCSINRIDAKSLSWGAQINFKVDFKWNDTSYSNVLADMSSPKLPIPPSSSKCTTKPGSYAKGSSVVVNCTQGFDAIPVGYANVITAFDGTDYPLGFSLKVPLSMEPNLQI
jgi:hypothetical protein